MGLLQNPPQHTRTKMENCLRCIHLPEPGSKRWDIVRYGYHHCLAGYQLSERIFPEVSITPEGGLPCFKYRLNPEYCDGIDEPVAWGSTEVAELEEVVARQRGYIRGLEKKISAIRKITGQKC